MCFLWKNYLKRNSAKQKLEYMSKIKQFKKVLENNEFKFNTEVITYFRMQKVEKIVRQSVYY